MLSNVILTCTVGWGGCHARELDGEHFRGLHGVTGTIPTELGLLTELTYL